MIDSRCIAKDVDRSRLSPQAEVSGASYLTGSRTSVGAGAIVRNSRLHDVAVAPGAIVIDSIIVAEGKVKHHYTDAARRTTVGGADQSSVGEGASVSGSTLINTAIGARSTVVDSWMGNVTIGEDCRVKDGKLILVGTGSHVSVQGPTEISEAYLGHHLTIDRRGYFEGTFSNKVHTVQFDAAAGKLRVTGTIDLPHVNRYGTNTINSANSGKIMKQDDRPITTFGTLDGLWKGEKLLSHEQIELAPCCWVVPWTKVVGQSPMPHPTDDDLVNDELSTYIMPFAVAGFQGEVSRGLVMPGELSVGLGPKQRKGAWVFTYAPDAVIRMVVRLYDALEPARRHLADTIVCESIETAIEMTKAMAHKNKVDLSQPADQQKPGWPRWVGQTYALLQTHLQAGLWKFKDGKPVGWRKEGNRWTHPNIAQLLKVAPDALENQKSEQELFEFVDPVPAVRVALPTGAVEGSSGAAIIDPQAKIAPDAFVGPGCRIGAGTVICAGASIWNSVLECATVAAGAKVERSILSRCQVGEKSLVRSTRVIDSTLGPKSHVECCSILDSNLADRAHVTCFGDVIETTTRFGTIIGGGFHNVQVDVYLMSMHMAGWSQHLHALPINVNVGGKTYSVPATPMLGGGSVVRGLAGKPVEMQCAFISSNAIIEANTYVAFGCFVAGRLGPDAGLLPFTASMDEQVGHHSIGGVLTNMPAVILTHFIPWTYNAAPLEQAPAVARMCLAAIEEGLAAIAYEKARRMGTADAAQAARFAKYRCLSAYSDDQLEAGLANYNRWKDNGGYEMEFSGGELRFVSTKGVWTERGGAGFWKANLG